MKKRLMLIYMMFFWRWRTWRSFIRGWYCWWLIVDMIEVPNWATTYIGQRQCDLLWTYSWLKEDFVAEGHPLKIDLIFGKVHFNWFFMFKWILNMFLLLFISLDVEETTLNVISRRLIILKIRHWDYWGKEENNNTKDRGNWRSCGHTFNRRKTL